MLLLLVFVLGITAGLRSLMPLALVAWTSRHRHALEQTWLAFMGWHVTAYILTALALVELVTDKLPFTPNRLTPVPFGGRILSGALCGATLGAAGHQSMVLAALVGAAGGIAGSFGGYHARHTLVTTYRMPDRAVALIEDVIAIGTAVVVTHSRLLI